MTDKNSLLTRLQTEVFPTLEAVAGSPFFEASSQGSLPWESYLHFLRSMNLLIQPCIPTEMLPALNTIGEAISRDLENYADLTVTDNPSVTLATLSLSESVQARYLQNPAKRFGYLASLLAPPLYQNLDPDILAGGFGQSTDQGFSFLEYLRKSDQEPWNELSQVPSADLASATAESDAVTAALTTAAALKKLFQVLYPLEVQKYRNLVMDLNPRAGSHAIPDDPREIQAAIRAGETTLKQTPYFEWRFGDRANKFAHSDSAWLAALTGLSDAAFSQQIDWLARLLAPRGIPQWVLEGHLLNLHAELIQFCPENEARYQKILKTAEHMKVGREQILDPEDFSRLAEKFEDQVKDEAPGLTRNTGKILVSAVTDEAGGINNAVESVRGWLTDPSRNSPAWIAAVEGTLTEAWALVQT